MRYQSFHSHVIKQFEHKKTLKYTIQKHANKGEIIFFQRKNNETFVSKIAHVLTRRSRARTIFKGAIF